MAMDDDDVEAPANLRPRVKLLLIVLLVNVISGAALLRIPYLRGRERARDSAQAFARFSACLFRGRVAEEPGLTLPRGERARFASSALGGDASWPRRCEPSLNRVAAPDATFVFPSVKSAE